MTDNWEQPELPFGDELPSSDNFKLKDFVGCAVLIAVGGYHASVQTRFDPKPAVRGCVVVLNGPEAGAEFSDVLIFNTRPVRTLRGVPGRAFVAHVDIDNTTSNPSVMLLDPNAEEYELARSWHTANPDRTNELVKLAVAAYEENEAKYAAPMPTQRQQQAQQQPRSMPPSAPPKGPNYGGTKPAASIEPGPPPPPSSAPQSGTDEPPF